MKVDRAVEILGASGNIPVQLAGERIWIEQVDTEAGTAKVHPENKPGSLREVNVKELEEIR